MKNKQQKQLNRLKTAYDHAKNMKYSTISVKIEDLLLVLSIVENKDKK